VVSLLIISERMKRTFHGPLNIYLALQTMRNQPKPSTGFKLDHYKKQPEAMLEKIRTGFRMMCTTDADTMIAQPDHLAEHL